MVRFLLVDDHHIVREGLVKLLKDEPDIHVVGEASDGREAIGLIGQLKPDVVVMDVAMPGMDGVEATRIIRREWPAVRVIGLSMNKDDNTASRMRSAGAEAYLTKGGPSKTLLAAIRGES